MGNVSPQNEFAGSSRLVRPRARNVRWIVVVILTLLSIINYLDRGNLSVAAPLIMKDLHMNPAAMGVILSSFVWPYAVMNLPSGWAVDKFGTKVMMSIAVGFWSVVAVATGFMRTMGTFILTRVLLGVGESAMFPAAIKATNAWFPKHEKGFATSIFIAGTQVGLAISPLLSTALMLAFGWQAMFIIIGSIGFLVLIGWIILYKDPQKHKWLSREEFQYIRSLAIDPTTSQDRVQSQNKITLVQWVKLFGQFSTWAMIIGDFALQYLFWFYITWLPTYLEKSEHLSISKTGLYASLPFIAGTLGVLIGGKISDWFIAKGMTRLNGRRYTIALGAVLTAVALLITAFVHNQGLAITLLTIGMFTYSLCSAPIWALATDVVESDTYVASIGSIQNFGGFLGGAFAPIVTGVLVASFGGFAIALVVTAILAFISAIMYALVLKRAIQV
ncbi:MFS transporter [Alicyclobacillus fastidiosus]|uniref:MFS transporter n=1 Tax=Alicyclobacillus fastidiosus TaxID=392011 RepID=UPI0023E9E19F|nr:MFS transporter [Alicyclobacillus fastidiosus]GMA63484.1 MFS transporter [Alicyclobacillus fastidiosus]